MTDVALRFIGPAGRRMRRAALLLLLVGGAPGCGAGAGGGSGSGSAVWVGISGGLFSEDTLTALDPDSGERLRSFAVEAIGEGIAVGEGRIWAVNPGGDAVLVIDPESGDVESIALAEGSRPSHVAIGEGAVWVGCDGDGNVVRIDPSTRTVVATIRITDDESIDQPLRIATGEGSVWVVDFFGIHDLHRIDPATNAVTGTVDDIGDGPVAAAVGAGAVWVTTVHDGMVARVDPRSLEITDRIGVGAMPLGVAYGAGSVWVANRRHGTVARVDPATNRLAGLVRVGEEPLWLTVANGFVWVTDGQGGAIARVDASTTELAGTLSLESTPVPIAAEASMNPPAELAPSPPASSAMPSLARDLGFAGDACALLTNDDVAAAAREPVRSAGGSTRWDESGCVYATMTGQPVLELRVSWRGGREEFETVQMGTRMAARMMESSMGSADGDIESMVTPGPVPGLGDAALFHDLMPSLVLAGDTLLQFSMSALRDAERLFIPLARQALNRLDAGS